MLKKILLLFCFVAAIYTYAQEKINLSYYLPQDINYNKNIPTPESVLGFQVGEWHVSHDKLAEYMKALAASSDRISIENRGKTYEGRPLLLLTITSSKNHQNLEEIRTEHLKLSNSAISKTLNTTEMPIVVYQGYSIHGNEPSGANAGMLLAYYLAAAEGQYINELLDNTIILFDPSYNPDGLNRFASWVNTHKNQNLTPDSNDREYNEAWPRGRTNHYWFDMNRDWLVSQLPESQARIKSFHQWKPNILTDHHEMGTNSSFFFQPGVPDRTHPLTPKMNQELTRQIGKYHAKAFDKIGSLYYSEEGFDDFYYGKGSTFPDINGGIGILFEQGSSRGHLQNSANGLLSFPFGIRNQFTAGLSTLKAAKEMRTTLLDYQRNFYQNATKELSKSKSKTIVFGDKNDRAKTFHFAEMLKRQNIKFHKNSKNDYSYVIPMDQPNSRMINAMFEKRTKFKDSLFYDVSAWTLPLAFNLDYSYSNSNSNLGAQVTELNFPNGQVSSKSDYAYIYEWDEYYTPKLTYNILKRGLRAKVAMKPFTLNGKKYDYGSIMVPIQNQKKSSEKIHSLLTNLAKESGVNIDATNTGLAEGIDLGSNDFRALKKPKIALIIGDGINSYDAGEVWHLLDTRYDIPITKLDTRNLSRTDLSNYTTIILPNSFGGSLDKFEKKLKGFVQNGGTLIGFRNSLRWLKSKKFINLNFKKSKAETKNVTFDKRSRLRGAQVIGGAIFEAKMDRTHPINFGYNSDKIALFRNTTLFVKPDSTTTYMPALQYSKRPLLSGYISKENLKSLSNTLPFKTANMGRGKVIAFTDNTNFRAFWYGTNKLMMNAIFFGKFM